LFRNSCVISALFLTGCYTLEPVRTAPEVGSKLAVDVTDVGRVALGGLIGQEIGQIEGRLVSQENGEFVLAVSKVRFLRGGQQVWTGEEVHVRKDHVATTYQKRFHKGRTIALTAVLVSGIVAIVVGQDLLGFGQDESPPNRTEPPATDLRPRRP
jgi:hypothetical protein